MALQNWGDPHEQDTFGNRADELWHVRESERLVSLGFIAPHLMTLEEQEIWTLIREYGYLWRGHWKKEGSNEVWTWECEPSFLNRERLSELWDCIVQVAEGSLKVADLPTYTKRRPLSLGSEALDQKPPIAIPDLDDDIPF